MLPDSPARGLTLALLIAGFGLKMGLVPLHVWLPIAHPAAPMPASAVLSGAIIKAGVIGLIRFLPFEAALPDWGGALTAIGLVTVFYGVAMGITQANPKTVLAYSSVSQMGFIATVLGMALAAGNGGATLAAAFYAAHHILAKGALFLGVGVSAASGARRWWPVLLPAALLALGFGGLPLTGGGLAKLAVKAPLGEGVVSLLATLAGAGSTLLMLHFLHRLSATADVETCAPPGLAWPWLAMAFAAVAIPWAVFPHCRDRHARGRAGAVRPVDSALAGAARRRARRRPAPLRAPSAARARGRHRGARCAAGPRRHCVRCHAGARGGGTPAMAGCRRGAARAGGAIGRVHHRPGSVTRGKHGRDACPEDQPSERAGLARG
jgi:formate hydrogenlyase subunit 3/multisubunit Na+/H+ antiporter MnhD subunit